VREYERGRGERGENGNEPTSQVDSVPSVAICSAVALGVSISLVVVAGAARVIESDWKKDKNQVESKATESSTTQLELTKATVEQARTT